MLRWPKSFYKNMKIKKGDTIEIISGKDSGKTGKITKVDGKAGTVLIEGLNMFKKHVRPKKQGEKGQVVSLPRPLNAAKVMLFCSSCKKGVRVGYKDEARICRKCKAAI